MNLWKTLGFIDVNFFSNMNLLDWIKSHSNGFAARNIVCVGNDSIKLYSVVSEARRLSSLLSVCFPHNTHQHPTRFISWHPSREKILVLNVDGSCSGHSGGAGAGGLIKRGDGSWVVGFSSYLGLSNNTYAEIMAI